MKQVSFIFATGAGWMDRLVTWTTRSCWSHAALRFEADGCLVEALAGRGLILQPGGKYDGWEPALSIAKWVPAGIYDEMLCLSRTWASQKVPYGYGTCMAIGFRELFGPDAGRLTLRLLPGNCGRTLVCTEALAKLWRIADPGFFADRDPRLISPEELFRALSAGPPRPKLTNSENVPIIVEDK